MLESRNKASLSFHCSLAFRTDRRGFKCIAFNVTDYDSCSEGVGFVRVKEKYAALWPFLGIVAEVVVLLTVILVSRLSGLRESSFTSLSTFSS